MSIFEFHTVLSQTSEEDRYTAEVESVSETAPRHFGDTKTKFSGLEPSQSEDSV